MQGRARLFIIVAFIIVLAAVLFIFLRPSDNKPTATPVAGGNAVVANTPTPTVPPATPIPMLKVVIALQDLPRGATIPEVETDPPAIGLWDLPENSVPRNAILGIQEGDNWRVPDEVRGAIIRSDVQRGQVILDGMLVEDLTKLARVGSDAAAILPKGKVAVAVPMDRLTSIAYAIQDGDYVDVIVSLLFVDVDEAFQTIQPNLINLLIEKPEGGYELGLAVAGRVDSLPVLGQTLISPSEDARPRLSTQRTIQEALVVHVGNFPADGRLFRVIIPPTPTLVASPTGAAGAGKTPIPATPVPERPDIITLGVTPQDAVALVWMTEAKLPITFALRAAGDASRPTSNPVTLDYLLQTYNITVPGKTNYSIQPAIRSIRQLVSGQQISLK